MTIFLNLITYIYDEENVNQRSVVFGNVTNYPTVIQKRDNINLCVKLIKHILLKHSPVMNIQKYKLSHSNTYK